MLRKSKLSTIEVLISKGLIVSYISHDELVSLNNVLKEYMEMKEVITSSETSMEFYIKTMETCRVSCKK